MASKTLENVIYPLITTSAITLMTILTLGAAFDRTAAFFTMFMIASQIIPWFAFLSYSANKNAFTSNYQKLSLCIAWFLVYVLFGNVVIYLSSRPPVFDNIWDPKYILPVLISGMTANHSIRILAVLLADNWFRVKNIQTPVQAMFAFNASAVITYKDIDKAKMTWIGWTKSLCDIGFHIIVSLMMLKGGAYVYHTPTYKSYIDQHPVLYYELSAIYTAIGIDFLVNRVSWINVFVYGDSIDMKYGMQFPALSLSPRDFWRRQSIYQREALKLGIFKPVIKSTGNYWLAVIMVFVGNYVVHLSLTWQFTLSYCGFYEWNIVFAILLLAVGSQLYVEKVFLKTHQMEYMKDNWLYKLCWFVILHIAMASVVYIGIPRLIPMGLETSYWWLGHYW